MSFPMPTSAHLEYARQEFKRIEPRDFFYWSVTKLVNAVIGDEQNFDFDELVRALMMLLTTWNKNYYRFFKDRQPDKTMEQHFNDLQTIIELHNTSLMNLRQRRLESFIDHQDRSLVMEIFSDFSAVLGRVGAAKCLHLLAPQFFPLWDVAILQGYGLEKASYRHATDTERYLAFMKITQVQLKQLGDISSITNQSLKIIDEYNYCRFTKSIEFK